MKKVLIVSSSLRVKSNSRVLAEKFAEGAREAGNEVELIAIKDLNLKFCIGCMSCQKTKKCVLSDSMNSLYDKFQNADVLVFVTPIYYYAVSGQLKTLLDRLNPLYTRDNNFKKICLLASAAEDSDSAFDGAVKDIQGFIDCFDGVSLGCVLRGGGLENGGDVLSSRYVEEAYNLGKSV